ncbi:hypothetical protein [Phaffia rhodozyma]|uniref:S-adenosyl-L-methionine-dependent methyltransferase n=1 Tax=Phaffia rhodozyma TaxID=264483 RepID=A0A0F7SU34_PHARH|nr:hypothetical protein [Phaffia rhodozyma]
MTAYGAGMEILSGMTDDQRCRVLDVGCGKGEWLEEMASRFKQPTYTGIDILPRPVVLPTVVHYVQADRTALPLPFPNNHFLFVHCRKLFSSLEGEDVYPMLLSECVRVLAPGGMIAFIEGRNAQTIQSNSGRPVDRLKEVMIEKLRKDMLIRKGLDTADLLMSLPKLMRDTGLGRIQVESLRPVKRNENIQN